MSFTSKDLKPFARGDTWTTKWVVADANDVPIDVTGLTFWLTLKSNTDDADPGAAQVSVVASSPDSNSGIVYTTMQPSATGTLTPGTYKYDFQQVDNQSPAVVSTLLIGKVRVAADVTRTT